MRECGESYDRLVEMLSEDESGRAKAVALTRELYVILRPSISISLTM